MKVLGIHHLGIVPKDLEKALWFFSEVLGLDVEGSELVSHQNVKTHFLSFQTAGSRRSVELLEPVSQSSPVAKFLEQRSGIHHMAIEVADLEASLQHMHRFGVQLTEDAPRRGSHGTLVSFVHPHSTGGILVELVQNP